MAKPAAGSRMFFFIFENKNLMLFKIDQPTYNCVTIDVLDAADQSENQNRKKPLINVVLVVSHHSHHHQHYPHQQHHGRWRIPTLIICLGCAKQFKSTTTIKRTDLGSVNIEPLGTN